MKRVALVVLSISEYQAQAPPGLHFAYYDHGLRVIFCMAGRVTKNRILHELEHAAAGGNEIHHPWWHLCIRSLFPIRFAYHNQVDQAVAVELIDQGVVELEVETETTV